MSFRSFSFFVLIAAAQIHCSSDSSSSSKPHEDAGADVTTDGSLDAGIDSSEVDAADASGPTSSLISQMTGSVFEAETHVVAASSGKLFAVWMALGAGVKNGYAFSDDFGASWTPPATMSVKSLGDPVAISTSDGSFYIGYLDGTCVAGEDCDNGHVWVARRAPGASSFDAPIDVSPADPTEFYDKPWLMTGSDGALVFVFNGRVGVYPNNVDRIVVARSSNGTDWTRTFAVPAGAPGHLAGIPHACISKQAKRMWVVHVDSESPIYASIRWSDDLGVTWPTTQFGTSFATPAEAASMQGYDLRCVGEGDDVWVMYGLASGPSSATSIPPLDEIRVAHSGDGGKTFDAPTAIKNAGQLYLRPEISIDPAGQLHVIAYSGSQEGDTAGSIRHFRSSDAGKTFTEAPLIHQPFHFTGDRAGQLWIGDYSGLFTDASSLYTTFVDNSSGASHIVFARVPLS